MAIGNYTDSRLVSKYIDGDETALSILINRHSSRIYSFIFSKVYNRDLTEDIFQDTFVKVIRTLKRGKYNEEGKFLPWVMRIAHNLVIDHFRKENRMPKYEDNNELSIFSILSDNAMSKESSLIQEQIYSDVRMLVEQLPADQHEVLTMRVYKEMSFKDISEQTGVSINTALGRMRYALINLRKLVEKHNLQLSTM